MSLDSQHSNLRLQSLLDQIQSAVKAERLALLDVFMQHVGDLGTPLLLNETTVAFAYRGPGDRVRIIGDMTDWSSEIALTRVADTDLFVHITSLPTAARMEYQLLVDEASMPDPSCPDRVLNGLGANSELVMPAYRRRPVFGSVRDGTKGTFERVEPLKLPAGILGYEKTVYVYSPPDDATSSKSAARQYPTVYILDGSDYIEYAHTPAVLDHLIEDKRIQPVIAVFVSPPNRHQPDEPNRTTEYGLNADYARFMSDELVPFVDSSFPTITTPEKRLIAGDSYAGLASAYVPFLHPDVFGLAYSQSGYFSFRSDALPRLFESNDRQPIRLFVDVGHYERTVGLDWLPDAETDFLAGNRRFRAVLEARDYDVEYREYPEGHTWGNWRAHLMDALEHFFGTDVGTRR